MSTPLLTLIAGRSFGVTDFVNPSQLGNRSVIEVRIYKAKVVTVLSQGSELSITCKCTFCVRSTSLQVIVEMTGGGVDYSFECIGVPSVMTDAFRCTKMVRFVVNL